MTGSPPSVQSPTALITIVVSSDSGGDAALGGGTSTGRAVAAAAGWTGSVRSHATASAPAARIAQARPAAASARTSVDRDHDGRRGAVAVAGTHPAPALGELGIGPAEKPVTVLGRDVDALGAL